jgi:hypothetical protein
MRWLLFGYCVTMWGVSACSMHELAIEDWEELADLPRPVRRSVQFAGMAVIVSLAPLWVPPAFILEWWRGSR